MTLRARADAAAQVFVDDLDRPDATEADLHHLSRVLRLREGEHVVASDGRGSWRLCRVAVGAQLAPLGEVEHEPAPAEPVRVWLPALKGERAEWAVAKLTELGVDEIGLLACDRAVVRPDGAVADRVLARWRRVAREAACQSRRVRLPLIDGPVGLAAAAAAGALRCDLDGIEAPQGSISLAVGPEGGWSEAERALGEPHISLGAAVLRTETAAVTAAVLLTTVRRAARHVTGPEAQ